jgi:hypothetical protein
MHIISVVIFCLVLATLIDIVIRDESQIRHLPKLVWIVLVILLPLIGCIIWFTVGREYRTVEDRGSFGDPRRWESREAAPEPVRSKSTEEQLAELEREIAEFKEQERIRRLRTELDEKRQRP